MNVWNFERMQQLAAIHTCLNKGLAYSIPGYSPAAMHGAFVGTVDRVAFPSNPLVWGHERIVFLYLCSRHLRLSGVLSLLRWRLLPFALDTLARETNISADGFSALGS